MVLIFVNGTTCCKLQALDKNITIVDSGKHRYLRLPGIFINKDLTTIGIQKLGGILKYSSRVTIGRNKFANVLHTQIYIFPASSRNTVDTWIHQIHQTSIVLCIVIYSILL